MRKLNQVIAVVVAATILLIASIQGEEFKSPDLRTALQEHEKSGKELTRSYMEAVARLDAKYRVDAQRLREEMLKQYDAAQNAATQSNDLDEALKIRDAAKQLKDAKLVIPGKPAVLEARIAELNAALKKKEKEQHSEKDEDPIIGLWKWHTRHTLIFEEGGRLYNIFPKGGIAWEGTSWSKTRSGHYLIKLSSIRSETIELSVDGDTMTVTSGEYKGRTNQRLE